MACPEKKRCWGFLEAFAFRRAKWWLGAIIILAVSGYFNFSSKRVEGNTPGAPVDLEQISGAGIASSRKSNWVCPMHPHVIRDHPGICPICGMDLVKMEHSPQSGNGVDIDTASQQRLGVRLATAELQTLSQDIHTYGNVIADESRIFNLSSKLEGVIKKLHVNSVGQKVSEGDVIYEIYSPELLKLQLDLIELLKENDSIVSPPGAPDPHLTGEAMSDYQMMEMRNNASKRIPITERMQYADAGIELIDEVYKTYRTKEIVEIRAPHSGFVTRIDVHEGSAIKPMDNLFSFADSSQVLVDVPLYPDQLAWVKNGDEVTVKLPGGRSFEIKARLKFIAPQVNGATRTVTARLSLNNSKNQLFIGSFLDVIIHAMPHKALAVPRSAVMRSGKGEWVMLAGGSGRFTPVRVETGIETGELIEITAGLHEGDRVAVNGQFLLDAAASMSATAQRMHNDHDTDKH